MVTCGSRGPPLRSSVQRVARNRPAQPIGFERQLFGCEIWGAYFRFEERRLTGSARVASAQTLTARTCVGAWVAPSSQPPARTDPTRNYRSFDSIPQSGLSSASCAVSQGFRPFNCRLECGAASSMRRSLPFPDRQRFPKPRLARSSSVSGIAMTRPVPTFGEMPDVPVKHFSFHSGSQAPFAHSEISRVGVNTSVDSCVDIYSSYRWHRHQCLPADLRAEPAKPEFRPYRTLLQ
jgi:hypothetical protein